MFVPELLARVKFMRERMELIKAIAGRPETAYRIAPRVAELFPDMPGSSPQEATKNYLKEVAKVADESFIQPLRKIEQEHSKVSDLQQFIGLLNAVNFVCSSIATNEADLFRYSIRVGLDVTDKASGKVVKEGEQQMDIILSPFSYILPELKRIAETTAASVEHWRQQQEQAKKPFLEFVAASTNAATSRRSIWIQLLAILTSLSFSSFFLTARDPFALKRENLSLKAELQQLREDAARSAAELEQLRALMNPAPKVPAPTKTGP